VEYDIICQTNNELHPLNVKTQRAGHTLKDCSLPKVMTLGGLHNVQLLDKSQTGRTPPAGRRHATPHPH